MSQYMYIDEFSETQYGKNDISLNNHEVYNSKEALKDAIDEEEERLRSLKQQLFGLCCGTPKDMFSEKDVEGYPIDPFDSLKERFDNLFDDEIGGIEYTIRHLTDMYHIYENYDKVKIG